MPTPEIVLITGGTSGLGLSTVKALHSSATPYKILVGYYAITATEASSILQPLLTAHPPSPSTLHPLPLDLESDASLQSAIDYITSSHGRLDILVNNAGANFDEDVRHGARPLRSALRKSWNVNLAGPHILTTLAAPLLLNSPAPRLLFITSGTSSLTETEVADFDKFPTLRVLNSSPEPGWPKEEMGVVACLGYRTCKTALNMLMREWWRMLRRDGVRVWGVSPGFLATDLATDLAGVGRERYASLGALPPSAGAEFIVKVLNGERDGDVGKVIRADMVQAW
ncbi:hypothetical protein M409DRAFT_16470 [Zasmidium cellare ATCC 36951]|uniref:NAD(P)-binding protein n=1 Tax=Zasmidium cellare ATCC 36951 TaxID=1080233 RepID=A0A6A6D457_ZASCE|nr:uncharacterized protein M409DRAFT_16470 [Zasmidium cellare ATCC 36951]KAF2174201.1 hypothetical protein M409DRAFT_16470 [Zasmidium cellare ATCC 36951]